LSLPGGLTLYWFVITLLTALQQLVIFRKKTGASNGGAGQVIEGQIAK